MDHMDNTDHMGYIFIRRPSDTLRTVLCQSLVALMLDDMRQD